MKLGEGRIWGRKRSGSEEEGMGKSINVYRNCKSLIGFGSIHSRSVFIDGEKSEQLSIKKISKLGVTATEKRTIFKLHIKAAATPEVKGIQLIDMQKNSIFRIRPKASMEVLTSLSQKESIIFNQVKNLNLNKPRAKPSLAVEIPTKNKIKKQNLIAFKRINHFKKVQESQEHENQKESKEEEAEESKEKKEEEKSPLDNGVPYKSLKEKVWRWNASSGSVVY
jgi:hypothetical protein